MEKQILKKLDNIRNNLLHSIDALSGKDYPQEQIDNLNSEKIDILSEISAFRTHIVNLFAKKENKKENKKD